MSAALSALTPLIDDSSSADARIVRGCVSGFLPCFWARAMGMTASITSEKKLFMSHVPRPYQRFDSSLILNGSECHLSSSRGTVSVCPERRSPSRPSPSVASRFDLPARPGISLIVTANPRLSSQPASLLMTPWLLRSYSGNVLLIDGVATSSLDHFLDCRGFIHGGQFT